VKALNDALFNFLLYHIENYLVDNIQGVRQTMHCILPEIEEFICNGVCLFLLLKHLLLLVMSLPMVHFFMHAIQVGQSNWLFVIGHPV